MAASGKPVLEILVKFPHVHIHWLFLPLSNFLFTQPSACQVCDLKLLSNYELHEDSYLNIKPDFPYFELSNVPKVFHLNSFIVPQTHYDELAYIRFILPSEFQCCTL